MVPGARTREDFLDGLRRGLTLPAGRSGGYARLTADVARIAAGAYRSRGARLRPRPREPRRAWRPSLAGLPLLPLLPLVTAAVFLHEQAFARSHDRAFRAEDATPAAASDAARSAAPLRRAWRGDA